VTTVRFQGANDDLVYVDGCEGADEFGVYFGGKYKWRGDLIAPGGAAMRIHAIYDGCWAFAVGQAEESIPLPPWPIRIEQLYRNDTEPGYSVELEIDAPGGTRLDNVRTSDET
jgi:hypothetical protein